MPEGPCEGGKCAYGSIYCGYPPCGGCCGCLGGCIVEYEERMETERSCSVDESPPSEAKEGATKSMRTPAAGY